MTSLLICKDCGAVVVDIRVYWMKHATWHGVFNENVARKRFENLVYKDLN